MFPRKCMRNFPYYYSYCDSYIKYKTNIQSQIYRNKLYYFTDLVYCGSVSVKNILLTVKARRGATVLPKECMQ